MWAARLMCVRVFQDEHITRVLDRKNTNIIFLWLFSPTQVMSEKNMLHHCSNAVVPVVVLWTGLLDIIVVGIMIILVGYQLLFSFL